MTSLIYAAQEEKGGQEEQCDLKEEWGRRGREREEVEPGDTAGRHLLAFQPPPRKCTSASPGSPAACALH